MELLEPEAALRRQTFQRSAITSSALCVPSFPSDTEAVFWSSGAPELGVAALRVEGVFGNRERRGSKSQRDAPSFIFHYGYILR